MKADVQATTAKKGEAVKAENPAKHPTLSPLLVLISAPSGGGKTTLCQQLLAARRDMTRIVTCTTRAPRPGEKNEVDYYFWMRNHFLSVCRPEIFWSMRRFLETATAHRNPKW